MDNIYHREGILKKIIDVDVQMEFEFVDCYWTCSYINAWKLENWKSMKVMAIGGWSSYIDLKSYTSDDMVSKCVQPFNATNQL